MFIRKLCVLLVLSAIIKISTSTDIHQYSLHSVNYNVRGNTLDTKNVCIRFLNYQQATVKIVCYDSNTYRMHVGEELSTTMSAGYQICTKQSEFPHDHVICMDSIFWWDGWAEQTFCNDLHIYSKDLVNGVIHLSYKIVNDGEVCTYPI